MLHLVDDDTCDSSFPRSRDIPSLPGCVLAPLSGRHHQTLLQIFTGNTSDSNSWKTWYKAIVYIVIRCLVYISIFSYYIVDREELKGAQVTQIDIGFYVVPSQTSSAKKFTLNVGEIKV